METTSEPRFLVTGSKGMLGSAVLERLAALGHAPAEADLPEVDLSREGAVASLFDRARPTHVLHCAAYTNVDGAESDEGVCRIANVEVARLVARACAAAGARMQLISTDFVFGGDSDRPYLPDDPKAPLGVYAKTKSEGEDAMADELADHQIVRTAWLFGPAGKNFVLAILGRLEAGQPLRVVRDQVGCPTYTRHLAERMVDLVLREATGAFHLANGGQCSWFEFAQEIARQTGHDPETIEPIPASEWPSPAPRPSWSVLDCSKAYELGVEPMPDWREGLGHYLSHRELA